MTTEKHQSDALHEQTPTNSAASTPLQTQSVPPIEGGPRENKEEVQGETSYSNLEQWNSSRVNIYRYLSIIFSFIILGMNDSVYGALIPYVEMV